MNAFVSIYLKIPFSDEETNELELNLKDSGISIKEYLSQQIKNILIQEADIPEEAIKNIIVHTLK